MNSDICGEETDAGEPCKRKAGWGRDGVSEGPCKNHMDEYHNPNKLTPERKSTLVGAAQEGAFKEHCALIARISEQTLRNWLNWGEEDVQKGIDSPCADLFLDFQRARGAGAVRCLKDANSEFILERSYGYNKTETHEVSGPGGDPIETEHTRELTERELAAFDSVTGGPETIEVEAVDSTKDETTDSTDSDSDDLEIGW